jgi:NagD protein
MTNRCVLVGFDTDLNYTRLCRAAYWINRGKPFLASHPDRVCPTDEPTVLVDCGAVCAALSEATGRSPDAVLGKPDPRMLLGLLHRHGLEPASMAMVGDRLYTDIEMARRTGVFGVLVLSGEATMDDIATQPSLPDLVVSSIEDWETSWRKAGELTCCRLSKRVRGSCSFPSNGITSSPAAAESAGRPKRPRSSGRWVHRL